MKTSIVTLIEVEYKELDEQVTKFLNSKGIKWQYEKKDQRYECVAEEEWGNDESHSFNVDGKVDEYSKEEIIKGNLSFQLHGILDWMAAEGVIEKGTYKIDICW
jgi:hypothetical protein